MSSPARPAPNGKPWESVWDFPRPPRIEEVPWRLRIVHGGSTVVDAPAVRRVLETSQPPAYYVAPEHVVTAHLQASAKQSWCEWKGAATYVDVVTPGAVAPGAAWTYHRPSAGFEAIAGWWSFYAQLMDECWIDDERVLANPGTFYGGWITSNVTGPFKGAPGTAHW